MSNFQWNVALGKIETKSPFRPLLAHVNRHRNAILVIALNLVFLSSLLSDVASAISQRSWRPLRFFTVMAIILFWPLLVAMVIQRQYWIVPGGVVERITHVFSRRAKIRLFTRESGTLIYSGKSDFVYLLNDGIIRKIQTDQSTSWAILAGWVSVAEPPTMEQLKQLLDPGNM